ncbi:MAG: hypothetical protein R6U26_00770 [Candidatus Undinarchaeales archaeon]
MKTKKYHFTQKEISHLAISVLVMSFVVAYSMISGTVSGFIETGTAIVVTMPASFVIIAPAFVLHELGHKLTSQRFGFQAEYRMWTQGLLFALLITIMSGGSFIFVAPGAVYFGGGTRKASLEHTAKIGISGPLVNLMLAGVFGSIAVITSGTIGMIGSYGAYVNAWLAIFNLIPFGPLDGEKILKWNKKVWGAAMFLGIAVFIGSMFI